MKHKIFRIVGKDYKEAGGARPSGLLMTATLLPPATAVARSDPGERMADYLAALTFYLSLPGSVIDKILFVDNSDADLNPLVEVLSGICHNKTIELISFSGNDHPIEYGKAYGEFRLMDFGLAHSDLFSASDFVWKTTGRLKFLNIGEMDAACKRDQPDLVCDLHNVPWVGSGKWIGNQNMDLRIFGFRRAAYDKIFRGQWENAAGGFNAEYLYGRVKRPYPGLIIRRRFPVQPRLEGISGRHQKNYASLHFRVRDGMRSLLRQVVPWLWI